jgi:hypothetical protein
MPNSLSKISLLISLIAIGCTNSSQKLSQEDLIGNWNNDQTIAITFKKDNTAIFKITRDGTQLYALYKIEQHGEKNILSVYFKDTNKLDSFFYKIDKLGKNEIKMQTIQVSHFDSTTMRWQHTDIRPLTPPEILKKFSN